jgi:hypothetical protein
LQLVAHPTPTYQQLLEPAQVHRWLLCYCCCCYRLMQQVHLPSLLLLPVLMHQFCL